MNRAYIFPTTLRVLSPAARCASPIEMWRAWRSLEQLFSGETGRQALQATVERYFVQMLEADKVRLCGSGKAALYQTFAALKNVHQGTAIAMSAYTCPDVAVAALRAGYDIIPVDISPHTLDLDISTIEEKDLDDLAAVVLSNLYGLPDELSQWQTLQARKNFVIIDDACQALASRRGEQRVGAAGGTVGILSFGRGKALSGVGGGAIVLGDQIDGLESDAQSRFMQEIEHGLAKASSSHSSGVFRDFIYSVVQWIFGSPYGFRIPASLPFLGIGTTVCEPEFSLKQLGAVGMIQAVAQLHSLERASERFVGAAERWHRVLGESDVLSQSEALEIFIQRQHAFYDGVVPIRYPLLLPEESLRDRVLDAMQVKGLGASGSYPVTLHAYPELAEIVRVRSTPQAESVARRILTLPVHRYVRDADMNAAADIMRSV